MGGRVGEDSPVVRLMLMSGLSIALGGAALAVLLFLVFRLGDARLLAAPRQSLPKWTGFGVLAAVGVFFLFNVGARFVQSVLIQSGFFTRIYGESFPLELPENPSAAQKGAATVRFLWSSAIAFPFAILAMYLLRKAVHLPSSIRVRSLPQGFVAGYLTWLMITPAAFCVFVLASLGHQALTGKDPEKHPLTQIADLTGPWKWLFVLQTVVIAAVIEEWLFRGVLLPWLAQRKPVPPDTPFTILPSHRPLLILLGALGVGVAFTFGTDYLIGPAQVQTAFKENFLAAVAAYLIPAVFFLLLLPFDFLLPRLHRLRRFLRIRSAQDVRAIWASSALFAAMHAHVWPSPIPLMVLAMGLGYLYLRTRSLVGPIVVHGMFNAVSAMYLILGGPA